MIRTRRIKVRDRVFRIPDLMRVAAVLDGQIKGNDSFRTLCKVEFDDGVIIEGAASEVFAEGELNRPSRPKSIQIWLIRNLNESVNVDLEEGESQSWNNRITISAADAESADALYTKLSEAIEKVELQSSWGKNHKVFLYLLLGMGLTFLLDLVFKAVGLGVTHISPEVAEALVKRDWLKHGSTANSFLLATYSRVAIAAIAGFAAVTIEYWLLSAWPSVEFNFGSPHLRTEKRKQRINSVFALILVPSVLEVVFEGIKLLLQ